RGRTEPFFVDSTGVRSGGGGRTHNQSGVTQAAIRASWIQSGNEFKTGVEYRDNRLDFDTRYVIISQSSATSYYYQVAAFKGRVGSRQPSAYFQHTWKPTQRLVVDDGLRWDGQYWISSEGKVAQTILDE